MTPLATRRPDVLVLAGILVVYLALAGITLVTWQSAGLPLTGDEPHYMVITRGIVVDHTLEQTAPYREAFAQGLFLGPGITDPPSPANTHAYLGPHGLFNIHSFGLPLLLAVPYALQGVVGAKAFLVLVGAVGVALMWMIGGVFTERRAIRGFAVAAVAIGMPLLPGANQIFPDLPAGVLALVGLYWLLTVAKRRPVWVEVLLGLCVAYLPLLQIKFAAPATILVVALAVALYRRDPKGARRFRSALVVVVPFAVLLGILFAFNEYAFGNLTGPYEAGAFQLGPQAVMVFIGLALDQNQGFVFQNLIALAGLVGVGLLFARRAGFTVVWMLVLLSLIVPNAVLANQYGGYSFIGRFGYAAALVFTVATLCALARLGERSRLWFGIVAGVALALQLAFWLYYTFSQAVLGNAGRVLYNHGADAWLQNYTAFYFPLQQWLPALYDTTWAFTFLPNYAWALAACALVASGFALGFGHRSRRRRVWMPGVAVVAAVIVVAGFVSVAPTPPRVYAASELLVAQGTTSEAGITASAETGSAAGYVTYGPLALLREGTYTLSLTYSSPADPTTVVGGWQPKLADDPSQWTADLMGTDGEVVTVSRDVDLTNFSPATLQARTLWNGVSSITIASVTYAPRQ
ncbi:hypothetical protein [Subtercola sp. YIM 133946]|uniref:hypothetical protein n=1 Tax=Subtercola sp. YIM 133946 TaxID=3118909 RepID=UPI002F93C1F5